MLVEESEFEQTEPMVSFTAFDRCDRCLAQAYVQASKKGHTELLFCVHHLKEFMDALIDTGWTLRWDEKVDDLYRVPTL